MAMMSIFVDDIRSLERVTVRTVNDIDNVVVVGIVTAQDWLSVHCKDRAMAEAIYHQLGNALQALADADAEDDEPTEVQLARGAAELAKTPELGR